LILTCSPTPSFPAGAVARIVFLTEIQNGRPAFPAPLQVAALLAAMVIVSPNRTVNRIPQIARQASKTAIFPVL